MPAFDAACARVGIFRARRKHVRYMPLIQRIERAQMQKKRMQTHEQCAQKEAARCGVGRPERRKARGRKMRSKTYAGREAQREVRGAPRCRQQR